jgi:hypothetical protein
VPYSWADLVQVRPAPDAHRVAIRAALTVLIALAVLAALGRLEWSAYATFGAFASVYGGAVPTRRRWRTQAALGLLLTAAVATGALVALSPDRRRLSIPVAAGWAVLAAALSDRHRWRPPGPMIPVFAVATCAAIPSTPAAPVVALAAAALAVGLGAAEGARSTREAEPAPEPPAGRQVVQAVRCGVAVTVAGVAATASGIGHPYWAMVSALVPLAAFTLRAQLVRGVHRAVGTFAGLGLAAVLLLPEMPPVAVVLVVVVLQGAAELLVVRHYGAALVMITPLALLLGQLGDPQPVGRLLADRLLETAIGVAVGLIVAVVTRRRTPDIGPAG